MFQDSCLILFRLHGGVQILSFKSEVIVWIQQNKTQHIQGPFAVTNSQHVFWTSREGSKLLESAGWERPPEEIDGDLF